MKGNDILRVVSKFLIPFILLFAFYVQFHGDYGPGGGFQAGVIGAAAFILYSLVFGLQATQRLLSPRLLEILASCGILIYGGVGVVTMMMGGKFLDYNALAHEPTHGQHLGINLVELGVGLTVFAIMLYLFDAFAGRKWVHDGDGE